MSANPEFKITRVFDAPCQKVWDAWTQKNMLDKWFGPKGVPIVTSTMNFKVGGAYHYGMQLPVGGIMWGRWIFREITPTSRIVWEHGFTDETGTQCTRHPFAPTWPLKMVSTLTFQDQGNQTAVTLTLVCENANEVESATFSAGMPSMTQGFGGTFDQLTEFLRQPE